jgi:cytochrome bd-type quinol oxidase subunit 2
MSQQRALKAVTVYALLILITTAWVYKFDPHGYNQTLDSLLKNFGPNAYIFIAIFSVASLVSIPIVGIAGLIGMIASRRLGRSALVWGFLCFVLSAANYVLWRKYGGMPEGDSGITPVTRSVSPAAPQARRPKSAKPEEPNQNKEK